MALDARGRERGVDVGSTVERWRDLHRGVSAREDRRGIQRSAVRHQEIRRRDDLRNFVCVREAKGISGSDRDTRRLNAAFCGNGDGMLLRCGSCRLAEQFIETACQGKSNNTREHDANHRCRTTRNHRECGIPSATDMDRSAVSGNCVPIRMQATTHAWGGFRIATPWRRKATSVPIAADTRSKRTREDERPVSPATEVPASVRGGETLRASAPVSGDVDVEGSPITMAIS